LRLIVTGRTTETGCLRGAAVLEPDEVEVDDRDNVEFELFEFFLEILALIVPKKPDLGVMLGEKLERVGMATYEDMLATMGIKYCQANFQM
jgi:hypothetical protein